LFNEHIQSVDFLYAAKYPTADFTSSKVNFEDDKVSSVDGTWTLKGISKPVTLTVTSFQCMLHPMLKKDACGANATAVVKRTDFSMGKYAPNMGDDVTLTISVEAVKK
jgi:polyisoprenoid-binding protein YceI